MKENIPMFEQILDPDWKPYNKNLSKIFNTLKKEYFKPLRKESFVIIEHGEKHLVDRTPIEHLFLTKQQILFQHRSYFNQNKHKPNQFYSKGKDAFSKQWFTFFKKLGDFFEFEYNDVPVSTPWAFDKKDPKDNNLSVLLFKPLSIFPAAQSLLDLGIDPLKYITEYTAGVKSAYYSPLLSIFNYDHITIEDRLSALEFYLTLVPDYIKGEYIGYDIWNTVETVSEVKNLFTIIKELSLENRDQYCMFLYNFYKNNIDMPIFTKHIDMSNDENTVKKFVYKNSDMVKSIIEKEEISSSIQNKGSVINKRRL